MARPGGRPARAVKACTSGSTDSRMAAAIARPSRRRALIRSPHHGRMAGDRFEVTQIPRLSEHDEIIADMHDALGRRVELHRSRGSLDPDDHDSEPLAEVCFDDAAPGQWSAVRY